MKASVESEKVPRILFDSRRYSAAEREAAFSLLTQSLYECSAIGDPSEFAVSATGYRVGDLVFSVASFSPMRFVRDARHRQGPGSEFFVLEMQLTGEQRLLMDVGHRQLLPRHINLRDWSCGFEAEATAMSLQSVLVPRSRLPLSSALGSENPIISWSMDAPDGRMLSLLWRELLASLEQVSPAEAESLAHAFLGFLDGLLGRRTPNDAPATLGAMQQFLMLRLRSEVGVADLCRRFHVSRSTVYRLFEPVGGVARFLSAARLERCRVELRHADPETTTVHRVAASWGYMDSSSFSRRFRARFGLPPSEVLGTARTATLPSAPPAAGVPSPDWSSSPWYREYMTWFNQASGWELPPVELMSGPEGRRFQESDPTPEGAPKSGSAQRSNV